MSSPLSDSTEFYQREIRLRHELDAYHEYSDLVRKRQKIEATIRDRFQSQVPVLPTQEPASNAEVKQHDARLQAAVFHHWSQRAQVGDAVWVRQNPGRFVKTTAVQFERGPPVVVGASINGYSVKWPLKPGTDFHALKVLPVAIGDLSEEETTRLYVMSFAAAKHDVKFITSLVARPSPSLAARSQNPE